MGFFRWAFLLAVWLVTWVGAVLVGGLLGGVAWAFGWGLMVYPWLALAAGAYWLAWRAARKEEADGTLFLRRCLECGRPVAEEITICPDQACDGVDFGYQWDVHRRDAAYRSREEATVAEQLNRERKQRSEQLRWIGNVTWRPYWTLVGWYVRGFFGRATYDTEPDQMRWWSSRMLAVGGFFAALVVNASVGPADPVAPESTLDSLMAWGRTLMVLAGALVLSGYIAVNGPGSMHARLRQARTVTRVM